MLTHLRHKHGSYHRAAELVVDVRIGALLDDKGEKEQDFKIEHHNADKI